MEEHHCLIVVELLWELTNILCHCIVTVLLVKKMLHIIVAAVVYGYCGVEKKGGGSERARDGGSKRVREGRSEGGREGLDGKRDREKRKKERE